MEGPRPPGPARLTPRISVMAPRFTPAELRTLFDAPVPVLVLAPEDDGPTAMPIPPIRDALAPLLAQGGHPQPLLRLLLSQLPTTAGTSGAGGIDWPHSLHPAMEAALVEPVLATTVPRITALAPHSYAPHHVALLAAEAAKARLELPGLDALRVAMRPSPPPRNGGGGGGISELHVPGMAEGRPALDRGSYVRLRPSPSLPAGAHGAPPAAPPALEVEARVETVWVQRERVGLRLPSRAVLKHCAMCEAAQAQEAGLLLRRRDALLRAVVLAEGAQRDGALAGAGVPPGSAAVDVVAALDGVDAAVGALRASLRPPTCALLPCGDTVVCTPHADALAASRGAELAWILTSPPPYSGGDATVQLESASRGRVPYDDALYAGLSFAMIQLMHGSGAAPVALPSPAQCMAVAVSGAAQLPSRYPVVVPVLCPLCGTGPVEGVVSTSELALAAGGDGPASPAPPVMHAALRRSTALMRAMLGLSADPYAPPAHLFNARFEPGLAPLAAMLRAVAAAHSALALWRQPHPHHLARRLFPSPADGLAAAHAAEAWGTPPPALTGAAADPSAAAGALAAAAEALGVQWCDPLLNAAQRGGVLAIVSGLHADVPFLLLGPAGTGKTRCLAEAVCQVMLRRARGGDGGAPPGTLVLVGPSDEAADVLLAGLLQREGVLREAGYVPASAAERAGGSAGVLRLNLPSRRTDSLLRQELRPYCVYAPAAGRVAHADVAAAQHGSTWRPRPEEFALPTPAQLARCGVVVCTAVAASVLRALALPAGADGDGAAPGLRVSHLFVDEASQALEAEALCALALCDPDTRVVLTGDPRQLGPVVRSALARERWLGVSLQERLLEGTVEPPPLPTQRRNSTSELQPSGQLHPAAPAYSPLQPKAAAARPASPAPVAGAAAESEQLAALVSAALRMPAASPAAQPRPKGEGAAQQADDAVSVYRDGGVAAAVRKAGPLLAFSASLNVNYRSHPSLLTVPSALFYSGTLVSQADPSRVNACLRWSVLPRMPVAVGGAGTAAGHAASRGAAGGAAPPPGFPLLCVGVVGADLAEQDSTSYGNSEEVDAVVWAVQALLGEAGGAAPPRPRLFLTLDGATKALPADGPSLRPANGAPITADDVGVIAPYRRQVLHLRAALRAVGLAGVSVGTVYNFQGAEKPVTVVTTVLSRAFEARLGNAAGTSGAAAPLPPAGLLFDAKGFNVAVTRAHSLLVCVGNPRLWARDPHWRALLQHAVDHGGYLGWGGTRCPLPRSAHGLWAPGGVSAGEAGGGGGAQPPAALRPVRVLPQLGGAGPGAAAGGGGWMDQGLLAVERRLALTLQFGEQEGAGRIV